MIVVEISVYKKTQKGKTNYIIKKGNSEYEGAVTLDSLAHDIRDNFIPKEIGGKVDIDCAPDFELSVTYGKEPIHYEALSPEEEKELFQKLHL